MPYVRLPSRNRVVSRTASYAAFETIQIITFHSKGLWNKWYGEFYFLLGHLEHFVSKSFLIKNVNAVNLNNPAHRVPIKQKCYTFFNSKSHFIRSIRLAWLLLAVTAFFVGDAISTVLNASSCRRPTSSAAWQTVAEGQPTGSRALLHKVFKWVEQNLKLLR